MTNETKNEDHITPTQKTIASAANLANLLPTGTVLAFETLIPSFSNNGACHPANKGLSISIIIICAIICCFCSFTDSFIDSTDGKFYYGIITREGIYILNPRAKELTIDEKKRLRKYKIKPVDYFHAFLSLTVFLIFALTDLHVKNCFFPDAGDDLKQIIINLPLGTGVFVSLLFTIFPTTRRGIGYTQPRPNKGKKSENHTSTTTDLEKEVRS
ncbi:hypothetical protein RchiOBHm_Chr3g0453871 [Rosa chinensis]|uniref:DUF679 domain membrane protein n=1 Tax=Rosa chinensis TaxID=74649 RepID=A0A2P6R6M8_ROSCH|nr:hypothetical protein RchiOBHm_Chr3g0453871 [Rosa chinensis]